MKRGLAWGRGCLGEGATGVLRSLLQHDPTVVGYAPRVWLPLSVGRRSHLWGLNSPSLPQLNEYRISPTLGVTPEELGNLFCIKASD